MSNIYYMRQGDTAPIIYAVLNGPAGPINLTGCTVKFHMANAQTSTIKVNAAATPDSDQVNNTGKVSYTWVTGDCDTAGTFNIEWEITYAGGAIETVPNVGYDQVIISAQLA